MALLARLLKALRNSSVLPYRFNPASMAPKADIEASPSSDPKAVGDKVRAALGVPLLPASSQGKDPVTE